MKLKLSLIIAIAGVFLPQVLIAQKTRVMSVIQMIDQGKYEEGREAIELALWNEKTANWHRTYFTKGLLCQTAYETGIKKNEAKLTNLYPDQLYVAYNSYEKALELDIRGRMKTMIAQNYYRLSNDFRIKGREHYKKDEYKEALRAFEHALMVNRSELVKAPVDTNLVYNAAMAAYRGENWDKAALYLGSLHDVAHEPASTILYYQALMETRDSVRAEEVLTEALELFDYDQQVVMYLINMLVSTQRAEQAVKVLDEAIGRHPDEYQFYWSRALVYRRIGAYGLAIEDFRKAIDLNPEQAKIYSHLGLIYYNRGIELREQAREVHDNEHYNEVRSQANKQFMQAIKWFEKSCELDPGDELTKSRLDQLYYQFQIKD